MRRILALTLVLAGLAARPAVAEKNAKASKWVKEPYAQPVLGLVVHTSNGRTTQAASIGGMAGLRYWERKGPLPRWHGNGRVKAAFILSSADARGYDVRVGNFLGPRWKLVGITTGPDLFRNQYQFGDTVVDPTVGVAWPLIGDLNLDLANLYVGVAPAWYLDGGREPVDWSKQDYPGLGHEFSYLAGVGLTLGALSGGLDWSYTIAAHGVQTGLGVRINLRP